MFAFIHVHVHACGKDILANSDLFLPVLFSKTFQHNLPPPVWWPLACLDSSFAMHISTRCTWEKKVKHHMLYLLLTVEFQTYNCPWIHKYLLCCSSLSVPFSFAGMPSVIQKQSQCCLPLFLVQALLFTHEHLGAVLCVCVCHVCDLALKPGHRDVYPLSSFCASHPM